MKHLLPGIALVVTMAPCGLFAQATAPAAIELVAGGGTAVEGRPATQCKLNLAGTGAKGTAGVPGPALQAQLGGPHGVVTHPRTGDLYIADSRNHRVLRIARPGRAAAEGATLPTGAARTPMYVSGVRAYVPAGSMQP